jgi:hypothetical protein
MKLLIPQGFPLVILRLMEGVWHVQEPNDPLLLELFGTDTLPTPYLAAMPVSEVITELQVRNPEHLIVLDEKALKLAIGGRR